MSDSGSQSDAKVRTYLIRILVECGEDHGRLTALSQLELIDVAAEKCLFDVGQFLYFAKTVLITHVAECDVMATRLSASEAALNKLGRSTGELSKALRKSERERAVLDFLLKQAHKHPGLEELRRFLSEFKCAEIIDALKAAGIDSMDKLRAAARTPNALKAAGVRTDVAMLVRRHLRNT